MLEADVYATPRGVRNLEAALAARPDKQFFISYFAGNSMFDMDYFAFRPRGSLDANQRFWKRTFLLCNSSHSHGLNGAEGVLGHAVRRFVGERFIHVLHNGSKDYAGHVAIGIDPVGMWHEPTTWHVALWHSVPTALFRLLGAATSLLGVGDLR